MSRRYHCRSCRTAFVSADEPVGRPVVCPKCGANQEPETGLTPAAGLAVLDDTDDHSVFIPSDAPRRPRRGLKVALGVLAVLVVAGVATVVSWPTLRRWWHPTPPDPVEALATAYLQALVDDNTEAARRLGTVELPPAIRTFRAVRHDKESDTRLTGSFAPITAFHARLAEAYDYDPKIGRFTPKNPLGPAAETLDALHEAQEKMEKDGVYQKMASGDPNDIFDAAESFARAPAALAKGILSPRKLIPSYKQLVEDAKPPLPAERDLALDFGANREDWERLLGRPYVTLKADGPFVLQRARVRASVINALGSSGDPPTTLFLTLTRFRLEGIDTGWRVTSATRDAPPPESTGSRHQSPGMNSF